MIDSLRQDKNAADNIEKFPFLLRKSTMFNKSSMIGIDEKKELNSLNGWLEDKMREMETVLKQSPPDFILETQKLLKKVFKSIFPIIGRENHEKSKIVAKIWNYNQVVVQELIEYFTKKIIGGKEKFAKELSQKNDEIAEDYKERKKIENLKQVVEQELQTLREKFDVLFIENEKQREEIHKLEKKVKKREINEETDSQALVEEDIIRKVKIKII